MQNKKENIIIDTIISILQNLYGYDFQHYSRASFIRRLNLHKQKMGFSSLAELIPPLINDVQAFDELIIDLSIVVTEMFRDPEFYSSFIKNILPKLKTYPFIKVWHAGCATGEEVYSTSILLSEHNFLKKSLIYGTDFNNFALNNATKGHYSFQQIELFEQNYLKVGGNRNFLDYFNKNNSMCSILDYFKEQICFFNHNLAVDNSFAQVEVIFCRNVLIYFDNVLRDRVIRLFLDSLIPMGFLCLGEKESLTNSIHSNKFKCIDEKWSIYQRISF